MAGTGYDEHEYDVVVIGAGGAGLRAAIESARQGAKTAIITKSLLGKAHTVMAEGGCAAALAILLFKWWDVVHSMRITESFILDVGTIVLATESFLLTMYVTSCHAFRHLVGGMLDRWDGGVAGFRGRLHSFVTKPWINRSHGFWFWTSLGFVFIGDLFVMSVANGTIPESSIVLLGGV